MLRTIVRVAACLGCFLIGSGAFAQSALQLRIDKIDPPNWWATMPKPMLLVKGEGFSDAHFSLSDRRLRLERISISANGHWAQLWLSASPTMPKTVTISATKGHERVSVPFVFARRKASTAGFAGFSAHDVMYLIMTDRFADGDLSNDPDPSQRNSLRGWHGGDLRGIVQHIGYLKTLGVTTVWITPVYQNHEPQSYHGYGATDMYGVDEHFGNLKDLQTLAATLHARGMKLVLDTVPNHVGPQHPWVNDPPMPDWFHGTPTNHLAAHKNRAPFVDMHAPERDRVNQTQGWFGNHLPDLNQDNEAVATYLRQNAVWWIEEASVDGLRIDTFPYISRQFWHDYHAELHSLYPRLKTVGEIFDRDPIITSSFAGGVTRDGVDTGLDTPFDFPSYYAFRDVFAHGHPMTELTNVTARDSLYAHPERLIPFLGNHDTSRFRQEVTNSGDIKLAFAVLLTMRGMPMIYSGDEIAMGGKEDPDNRHDFPGGFPQDPHNVVIGSSRTADEREMHDWVKSLIQMRTGEPAFGCGGEQVLASDADMLLFLRDSSHGCPNTMPADRVIIAVNRGTETKQLNIDIRDTWLQGCHNIKDVFGTSGSEISGDGDKLTLTLSPRRLLVARCG